MRMNIKKIALKYLWPYVNKMDLFSPPVEIIVNPSLSKTRDSYFVGQSKACIANYGTPIITGGVATCSVLIMYDDALSLQLLSHVGPMDYAEDIRDGINDYFNLQSKSLIAVIIPGAGMMDIKPTLSVPIAERALDDIKHVTVNGWYTNSMECISVHNGLIQKCDRKSVKSATESLSPHLLRKPF
jgi:hypothetical protein